MLLKNMEYPKMSEFRDLKFSIFLKYMNSYFRNFSNRILIMNLIFIRRVSSDQNSYMPFLKNKSNFHVCDILKLVGCKMSPRKLLKLNETSWSHPTA